MFRTVFLLVLIFVGCTSDNSGTKDSTEQFIEPSATWSVPKEEVLISYSPFPLVTNSSFVAVEEVDYVKNHQTTLISLGPNELRAYPNAFIGQYEIINNEFEGKKYAITHCPQTVSTICLNRIVDGDTLTFKASGFLFRENLMPTDVETGTIWSQMLMRGVSGKHDFVFNKTYNVVETDWQTVKTHFPHAKVYNEVVDNVQIIDDSTTFVQTNRDFFRYGVLTGTNKITVHIFKYDLFEGNGLKLISSTIGAQNILIIGNKLENFISSYIVDPARQYSVNDQNTFTFLDNLGNIYNGMGLVIEGPDKDLQLDSPKAYVASWQAWQDFFENFETYE